MTSTEKKKRYRAKYPIRYAFTTLRDNAKRRGKVFTLTFQQFQEFAIKTQYMIKKGIWQDSYHIDRINEAKGYTPDNIQLLTNSDNVKKYLRYNWSEEDYKMLYTSETIKRRENNAPF